jgi:hypothetical protein
VSLSAIAKPPLDGLSGRFFLVGYLPTYASAVFILILLWAGAPAAPVSFGKAWQTAAGLGVAELALIALVITLVAVLFAPLQLALTRLLEGGWPAFLGSGIARAGQLRRKRRLERATRLPAQRDELTDDLTQRAGVAATRLRRRYPLTDHLVRPTALGNALCAMEDTAGQQYGWDAVVAWPRLYTVLGDNVRQLVDDRRDTLDGAVRMSATAAVTALITAGLLYRGGWWLLLVLIPAAVAVVAYLGAVQAAVAYGEAVHTAFDLHRFDLLAALHLPLPADTDAERQQAGALCDNWRQAIPTTWRYDHRRTP